MAGFIFNSYICHDLEVGLLAETAAGRPLTRSVEVLLSTELPVSIAVFNIQPIKAKSGSVFYSSHKQMFWCVQLCFVQFRVLSTFPRIPMDFITFIVAPHEDSYSYSTGRRRMSFIGLALNYKHLHHLKPSFSTCHPKNSGK